MRFAVTQNDMRQIDNYMINKMKIPGIVLMENAAMAVVDFILHKFKIGSVAVFCGCGNNGGDGFAVARGLIANGYDVQVILIGDELTIGGDARINYEFFEAWGERLVQVRSMGNLELAEQISAGADIVVDALFGTGISREIEGIQKEAVNLINQLKAYKVSVDIPSGIAGDTGAVMGLAVRADTTITFQYPKIGHYLYPGKEYTGELKVVQIGVDAGCPALDKLEIRAISEEDCGVALPARRPNTNKGDYGRLLIVAGSLGMAGAAALCSHAAVRAGAGLTTLASIEPVVRVVQNCVPEVVCRLLTAEGDSLARSAAVEVGSLIRNKTALAVGPGLSDNRETREFVNHMVTNYEIPKVFDADSLNVLSQNADVLLSKSGSVILTPHPKEFSRLAEIDLRRVLTDPIAEVRQFITKYDVTLVLKGAVTIVANRDSGITLVSTGSPGMAKGGSGDVLTGIIASLCAQGFKPYQSAVLGVLINGMAGKLAAQDMGEYAMTASDTIRMIGKAIEGISAAEAAEIKPLAKPFADREAYRDTPGVSPEAEKKPGQENDVRLLDEEPITLGTEGLEEHFNFLSPEEEVGTQPFSNYETPFISMVETQPRQGIPDHRRIVPKPYKRP